MTERIMDQVVADSKGMWYHASDDYAQPYHYPLAMLTCMRAAGWPNMDYGTLLVESGVGLSFGYKRNACVHMYALQWTALDRIASATGCRIERTVCDTVEDVWVYVTDSIDRGLPVACEYAEFHVVAGYRQGTEADDRAILVLGNYPISNSVVDWLDWGQISKLHQDCPWSKNRYRFEGRTTAVPPVETATNVMRWLEEWSHRHPARDHPLCEGAQFGTAAIEAYAHDLGDISLTVEGDFQWGNNACHAITPQWTSRRHIAAYLREKAPLFERSFAAQMAAAAAEYDGFCAAWERYDELLGQRFVHRHGGDQTAGWASIERRKAGSQAVYQAAAHERGAVAEISQALETLKRTTSQEGPIS